jgi:hypothetical protein
MRGLRDFFVDEHCRPAKHEPRPPRQDQDHGRDASGAFQERMMSDRTKEADLAAIKARCELNYAIAQHSKVANNPIVIAAFASAKASEAAFLAAVAEADAARGLRIWRAYRHVRQACAAAGNAQDALCAAIETAEREPVQSEVCREQPEPPLQEDVRDPPTSLLDDTVRWACFRGRANTDAIIRDKAMVVTALVMMTSENALLFSTKLLADKHPAAGVDEPERQQALAEIAAFLLRFVARRANFIGAHRGALFFGTLLSGVADTLKEKGVDHDFAVDLIGERFEEYAQYREWHEKGQSPKGTAFHEFSKKVATILHIGADASFDAHFTNLILRSILGWKLHELLSKK